MCHDSVTLGVYLDGPAAGQWWQITETIAALVRVYPEFLPFDLSRGLCLKDLPLTPSDRSYREHFYRRLAGPATMFAEEDPVVVCFGYAKDAAKRTAAEVAVACATAHRSFRKRVLAERAPKILGTRGDDAGKDH
jgi:hypothetical protein